MGVKTTLGTPVAVTILTGWPVGMLGMAPPEAAGLALATAPEAAGLALAPAAAEAAGLALAAAEEAGLEAAALGAEEGLAAEGLDAGAAAPPPHAASALASASGGIKRENVFIPPILCPREVGELRAENAQLGGCGEVLPGTR